MNAIDLAIIGGTGLYQLPGLSHLTRIDVDTPYGQPSAAIILGELDGARLAFLARHGEDHALAPHQVNYRANVWALRHAGAQRVLGINSVGGIRADMAPRTLALPDQLIDYTHGRVSSFCDAEHAAVQHIEFAQPYSASLRASVMAAAVASSTTIIDGGCYAATQGPRLETCAEIARLRRDGCDLVGMTGMPEAALARELDLDYACLAIVANWAAGCADEAPITLDEVIANVEAASKDLPSLLAAIARKQ
ncbi:MAG: S-methyl-5'-thioinosine phosphorylase [Xanthomonadales bacterium]|nr:S-methyl-5'-thioinosine phosphorylase [Xanthomonadales bacterium]